MTPSSPKRSPAGDALSALIRGVFRFNNLLVSVGDRLVKPLGLTAARWQILGVIATADRPEPVAWLARDLGAHRQNVQRIINDLHQAGFVTFEANPHHRRAQLVVLTAKGKQIFQASMRLQAPWVDGLAQGLSVRDIETAQRVMLTLRRRLDGTGGA